MGNHSHAFAWSVETRFVCSASRIMAYCTSAPEMGCGRALISQGGSQGATECCAVIANVNQAPGSRAAKAALCRGATLVLPAVTSRCTCTATGATGGGAASVRPIPWCSAAPVVVVAAASLCPRPCYSATAAAARCRCGDCAPHTMVQCGSCGGCRCGECEPDTMAYCMGKALNSGASVDGDPWLYVALRSARSARKRVN
jgi:hypothetical protein